MKLQDVMDLADQLRGHGFRAGGKALWGTYLTVLPVVGAVVYQKVRPAKGAHRV